MNQQGAILTFIFDKLIEINGQNPLNFITKEQVEKIETDFLKNKNNG